jgi:hypothetical protein
MKLDLVLYWMTHTREGSWAGFRDCVAKLAPSDADVSRICRHLRNWLSDFGHADFFVGGSLRWKIMPPVLAGHPCVEDGAILIGGRTQRLVQSLSSAAEGRGCKTIIEEHEERPTIVRVIGPPDAISATATAAAIPYIHDYQRYLLKSLIPIQAQMDAASIENPPINWTATCFDFKSMTWVEGCLPHSACEFSSRFGPRRYYLYQRRKRFRPLSKREAVYASAMLQYISLMQYHSESMALSVQVTAPMPELTSRIACLCSGMYRRLADGRYRYDKIPAATASVIFAALGQPNPFFNMSSFTSGVEAMHG